MCGIAGFFDTKMNMADKDRVIRAMGDRISHRGPDGEGYFTDGYCALAHKRLSIIDLAGGAQPMYSNDGKKVIVFNGEIYNYKQLKKELTDYEFKTASDTEVLLAGYEKWGEELPGHLRGMFAFAIYDTEAHSLFMGRDHFGIKPLYIYEKNGTVLFASEIKAFFAHPAFEAELDESLLSAYMTFSFTPAAGTFFKHVYRLEAGYTLFISENSHRTNRYFAPSYHVGDSMTFEEAAAKTEEVMKDSVIHHMIADVEVGSFLSGGVDSSYVVSLAKPDKTFTVGYAEEKYSEIDNAKDLADRLGIDNRSEKIDPDEYMDVLDRVLYHMDEPSSDPAIISLYFVARLAARSVKVVLSGEGSDEFFGGYNTYHTLLEYAGYDKVPYPIRHAVAGALSDTKPFRGRNFLVRRGLPLEDWYVGINRVYEDSEIKKLLKIKPTRSNTSFTSRIFNDTMERLTVDKDKLSEKDIDMAVKLIKMQSVDISCWLVKDILQKADRMTMAHSLEGRVPFTDKEVFKLASCLPFDAKLRGDTTKAALREAARKVIPNESYARKKLGFPVPVREWMKSGRMYEEIHDALSGETANMFFDTDILMKALKEHALGEKDNYRKLWNVFIFVRWYEIFFGTRRKEYGIV